MNNVHQPGGPSQVPIINIANQPGMSSQAAINRAQAIHAAAEQVAAAATVVNDLILAEREMVDATTWNAAHDEAMNVMGAAREQARNRFRALQTAYRNIIFGGPQGGNRKRTAHKKKSIRYTRRHKKQHH